MRKFAILLIVVGIIIAGYPLAERLYTWHMQNKIAQEFAREYQNLQPVFDEQIRAESQGIREDIVAGEADQPYMGEDQITAAPERQDIDSQPVEPNQPKAETKTPPAIGMLTIDKIKLTLPILQGATNGNLKIGAGLITGTTAIGEIGNTALAAHRSHTYGRFFNRLNELEIDDLVTIDTGTAIYQYRVYETKIVNPDDVSVLSRNDRDVILTLVTCDPIDTGTHRLIVHAILDRGDDQEELQN